MNYYEFIFSICPCSEIACDILSGLLADAGFESFEETGGGLKAYVQENLADEPALEKIFKNFPLPDIKISYTKNYIESRDWNEEWEKNYFQPIIIDNQVVIHSSFHKDIPGLPFDIVIDPKMAFGTGHHATTSMMVSFILETDLAGKTVLDMGCGTAVLAILAKMRGAARTTAIDNDRWAYENALENLRLNGITGVNAAFGDASLLGGETYDLIFANINRNILLADIPVYAKRLNRGGSLVMSGFYPEDIPVLQEKCGQNGLKLVDTKENSGWASVRFTALT
ncbi:MAG: 50S ribosomal protein L11 methyltransferase [Dysgonamonadaceae bacterium]|jgi:ribosomal protein L11 methyltransferase|nr:50S ribosomal protein L11 methyltransferase [Dysgonamonadaceae bacterium]